MDGCQHSFGVSHSRTSLSGQPNNLPPFAMSTAFPWPDYYGGSVTLGLAPCRSSRISSAWYVRATGRRPIHPFVRPRWALAHASRVGQPSTLASPKRDIGDRRVSDGRHEHRVRI